MWWLLKFFFSFYKDFSPGRIFFPLRVAPFNTCFIDIGADSNHSKVVVLIQMQIPTYYIECPFDVSFVSVSCSLLFKHFYKYPK